MSNSKLLDRKTALITGANRGIGQKLVEVFAQNGCTVYACARKETPEFCGFLNDISLKYSTDIRPFYFDLADETGMRAVLKQIVTEKLPVDILINNAGVAHGGLLQMTSIDTVRKIFEINFFSQLLIIQYISKLMQRQKCGSIVNMASVTGIEGYPGYSAYGSSKAALIYLTKTLSTELAPYNIRINAIAPGLTDTDMAAQMERKAKEIMVLDSAMNRLALPVEIANVALFLASDLSTFINGQILRVDGGM
jgi:3-oxoacyl-[acyl-carrier protein] reductase